MKKVSIITPAYNAADFIAQTIQSVLEQTYQNWEMIIVDDVSFDNTYEIASTYAKVDNRIKVIKHKENQGVAKTRNTALKMATGDYIAFLDSDDLWLPEKLEKQLSFMNEKDCAFCYSAYQVFNSQTCEMDKVIFVPEKMEYKDIFKNTAIACLTVIVDKSKVGDFEMPMLKHAEDQCTWQSILQRGYIAYGLNECLALYRVSRSSLTSNKFAVLKRQWYMYRKYHKLGLLKSSYYFACYAFNAVKKRL